MRSQVSAIWGDGRETLLDRIHDSGLFSVLRPKNSKRYRLRVRFRETVVESEDPYRFPPVLSDFDLYLLNEGSHLRSMKNLARI